MKKIFNLVYGVPIVLFFFSAWMNLAGDAVTRDPIVGSSLLDQEFTIFGSMLSPMFVYFLLSIIGLVIMTAYNNETKVLGKGIYTVSMISGFFIYRSAGINEGFISQTEAVPTNSHAFGGILLLISVVFGLIIVAMFIIVPIIKVILEMVYGDNASLINVRTKKAHNNPFEELKKWKLMLDENVITDDEYVVVKDKTLDNLKLKKIDTVDSIKLLKQVEEEGLITTDDFEVKKKELI